MGGCVKWFQGQDSNLRGPDSKSGLDISNHPGMAPGQGNDPRSLESESSVMPLDQPGVAQARLELASTNVSDWHSTY